MATVTCKYCGKKFDRQKEPYIQIPLGSVFRYAHSQCYLNAVNDGKEKQRYEIYDPKKFTNCFWCSKVILPTDKDVIELPKMYGRYAHKTCANIHPADDREHFGVFLIQLFELKEDYSYHRLMLQAATIAQNYNFTYSGMEGALTYFHKVQGHPVDKTKGIGIIPYIYGQAKNYYTQLQQAIDNNKEKDINQYIPKDIVIMIKPPQREIEKRKLFTFLDEEDINAK